MNAIKNGLVIILLAGVGYGVYLYVNGTVSLSRIWDKNDAVAPPGVDTELPTLEIDSGAPIDAPAPAGLMPSGGTARTGAASMPFPVPPAESPRRAMSNPPVAGPSNRFTEAPPFNPDANNPNANAATDAATSANTIRDSAYEGSPVSVPPYSDDAPDVPGAVVPKTNPYATTDSAPSQPNGVMQRGDVIAFAATWKSAQNLLDQGKLAEAQAELSDFYGLAGLSSDEDAKLSELLGQLAGTIIYSNADHVLLPAYEARPGDTLQSIAQQHKISPQLLGKINGLDSNAPLSPGARLKVVRGPFDAVVDFTRGEIVLALEGRYAGRFPIIGTASDFPFPNRTTLVQVVEMENQHGEHWIGFGANMGICCTLPTSAGESQIPGSIVVGERDAPELFDILSYDSRIEIRK